MATMEVLRDVVAALNQRGITRVTIEYPGFLSIPDGRGGLFAVGDANETWGGEHYDTPTMDQPDNSFATTLPRTCGHGDQIAAAIYGALLMFKTGGQR